MLQFPLGANGNVAPTIDIQGSNTLLTSPRPLGDDFSFAMCVAFDSLGNQYVFQYQDFVGGQVQYSINVFAAGANGNVAPIRRIVGTLTGFNSGIGQAEVGTSGVATSGICLDASGNIYAGLFGKIYKFPAGSDGNVASTIWLNDPTLAIGSLTFDAVRQLIWASDQNFATPRVIAYNLDGTVSRTITSASFSNIVNATIGPDGSIYVGDFPATTTVFVFSPTASGLSVPVRTITTPLPGGLDQALGIAVDTNGRLYIAAGWPPSTIYVYAAGASDALGSAPVQTIAGNLTLFDHMLGTSLPPNAVTNISSLAVR